MGRPRSQGPGRKRGGRRGGAWSSRLSRRRKGRPAKGCGRRWPLRGKEAGAPRSRWEEQPRGTLTAGLPASRTRESNGCCLWGNLLPRHSEPNASGTAALQGHRLCPVRLKARGASQGASQRGRTVAHSRRAHERGGDTETSKPETGPFAKEARRYPFAKINLVPLRGEGNKAFTPSKGCGAGQAGW